MKILSLLYSYNSFIHSFVLEHDGFICSYTRTAYSVDLDNMATASAADCAKSPENFGEKQAVSPTASVEGLSQGSTNSTADQTAPVHKTRMRTQRYEAYRNPRRMWKQQKQSTLHVCGNAN